MYRIVYTNKETVAISYCLTRKGCYKKQVQILQKYGINDYQMFITKLWWEITNNVR